MRQTDHTTAAIAPRALHAKAGVGLAAHIVQGRELAILRAHVAQPVLILVEHGVKSVRSAYGAAVRAQPGQAIILQGDQTVDFTNTVTEGEHYAARWLVFDPALLGDAYYRDQATHAAAPPLHALPHVTESLSAAFLRASEALAAPDLPPAVARQRVLEVMHWLLAAGVALNALPRQQTVSARVRALFAACLDDDWSAGRIARTLALSEATLRRRLAGEGTSLSELLVDTRMSTALTLLQATTRPVADIALAVGYASPSRFAVRFRQRYGFAPTAVRGHERGV